MKIFFKENFSLRRILGTDIKHHKGKAILIIALLIYGLGAFLFTFGLMFFDLAGTLNQIGLINTLLIYGFIYGTMLSIMFVLFRANGYLFNYKDYEILEPLPIKNNTVLAAKTTVMLTFILASVLVVLAPIMFSYYYHGGFDFLSFIFMLFALITIPIIPTVVFSFISMLIARLTSRFRKNNIVYIILLFAVFLGLMYLSISMNSMGDINPLLNQREFMEKLGGVYPPIKWFVEAVADKNFISLLLLIVSNIAVFAGFIFAVRKLVRATNQRGLTKVVRKNNKKAVSKKRSVIATIAAKESRTFFNTPIYVFNVGFGPVILLVLSVASLFFGEQIEEYLTTFISFGIDFEIVILILIGFTLSMTYSTAVSLSLEGKNLWMIKSLPIKASTVMHGKMLFNILLGLPIAILALLLFTFTLEITMIRLLIMIVFVTSISLVVTTIGSIINLYMPKFEFRNPAEVVKQSAGAFLGMFSTWLILFGDGFLFYKIYEGIGFEWGFVILSCINLILASVFLFIVNKKAESLFIKFEV
ncbi:hypothetical protein ACAG96_01565 [Candidatus Izemoplasma sp. B36]|uniref:putative ABC transporter permease subunit n=1 Tax=Candidatus Izemoplasma sp. B36 TaxID=3242468 RepID=UPI003558822D